MSSETNISAMIAPETAPLRTLAALGDEGMASAKTDLAPRSSFPVHPDWYERYWYGERSQSRWRVLADTVWWLGREMSRIAEAIRRNPARNVQRPRSVHT